MINKEILEQSLLEFKNHLLHFKKFSPRSVEGYTIDSTQLVKYLESTNYKMSEEILKKYILELSTKFSLKTVQRKLATIKLYINSLHNHKYIDRNYALLLDYRLIKTKRDYKRTYYSQNELLGYLNTLKFDKPINSRNSILILLLYTTGVRASEAVNIRLQDISLDNKLIIIQGKGNKERYLPISDRFKEQLENFIENDYQYFFKERKNNYLFQNYRGTILSRQRVAKIAKVFSVQNNLEPGLTPHDFRYLCATHLLENGVKIADISKYLGHESISTTQEYLEIQPLDLKQIYDSIIK